MSVLGSNKIMVAHSHWLRALMRAQAAAAWRGSRVRALDGLCLLDTPNDSDGPRELGLFASAAAFCGSTTCAGPRLFNPEALAGCGISNCVLAEYSSAGIALQDDPYTPSTHTSLESPRNGGIYGYFTFEH
eukprot:COSAG01_NODE_42002_length_444_cov_4.426087_2_plen_130_part_01